MLAAYFAHTEESSYPTIHVRQRKRKGSMRKPYKLWMAWTLNAVPFGNNDLHPVAFCGQSEYGHNTNLATGSSAWVIAGPYSKSSSPRYGFLALGIGKRFIWIWAIGKVYGLNNSTRNEV